MDVQQEEREGRRRRAIAWADEQIRMGNQIARDIARRGGVAGTGTVQVGGVPAEDRGMTVVPLRRRR